MLDIFLSNKIPSTADGWTDELIRVASIHNEFDGLPYDYNEIAGRFAAISTRVPGVRDSSDYRDEYGAYVSYLGLMHYEKDPAGSGWICRMSKPAKSFLCDALPDPEAFMRWQLALFQYPNPIGAAFQKNGTLRVEHKSLEKRLQQVNNGVKTIPLRLILRVLLSLSNNYEPAQAYVTFREIWGNLFKNPNAVGTFDPDGIALAAEIIEARGKVSGSLPSLGTNATNALRNLHIFSHTGLINYNVTSKGGELRLVAEATDNNSVLANIARTIANMSTYFDVPSQGISKDDLKKWSRSQLESGAWAEYYSGNEIPTGTSSALLVPVATLTDNLFTTDTLGASAPLRDFTEERQARAARLSSRKANPEETAILREKANLQHRAIVSLIVDRLRAQDTAPLSNIFIDVAALQPKKLLFEVKSCRLDNMLAQVRKGVSQLYEYRYRHSDMEGAKPVLVLEKKPSNGLEWLINYLVKDRQIALCWLEGDAELAAPAACEDCLGKIVNRLDP